MKDSDDFGYLIISRKAFDADAGHQFWLERREYSRWEAWIDVLQMAAFRAHRRVTDYFGVVDLGRGEFVASLRWLADRWGWTVKRVRAWIAVCERGAQLRAQRKAQMGTVYLVVNYEHYQTQAKRKGTAKGTRKGIPTLNVRDLRETGKRGIPEGTPEGTHEDEAYASCTTLSDGWDQDEGTAGAHQKAHRGHTEGTSKKTGINTRKETTTARDAADQLGLVDDPPSDVQVVLDHYTFTHPRRRPGDKERKTVERALRTYSAAELMQAIDGNAGDDWHREKGKHDLTYVLRDNGKIDDFIARAENANGRVAVDENGLLNEIGMAVLNGNGRHP